MVMAVRYWKKNNPESNECPVYLAWAGLEPLSFTNLFPTWTLHDEIAELNIRVIEHNAPLEQQCNKLYENPRTYIIIYYDTLLFIIVTHITLLN